MTTYATVDELQERLDWTLEDGERKVAQGALDDLSEWARHYGREWAADNVPALVVRLVLSAAARFMRNPDGFETSRAGDETLTWQRTATAGTASFNELEQRAIGKIANPNVTGLHSLQMVAYGNQPVPDLGLVPVDYGGEPFPYFGGSR